MLKGVSLLKFQDAALELGLVGLESTKGKKKKKKEPKENVGDGQECTGFVPQKREMSESSHRD